MISDICRHGNKPIRTDRSRSGAGPASRLVRKGRNVPGRCHSLKAPRSRGSGFRWRGKVPGKCQPSFRAPERPGDPTLGAARRAPREVPADFPSGEVPAEFPRCLRDAARTASRRAGRRRMRSPRMPARSRAVTTSRPTGGRRSAASPSPKRPSGTGPTRLATRIPSSRSLPARQESLPGEPRHPSPFRGLPPRLVCERDRLRLEAETRGRRATPAAPTPCCARRSPCRGRDA